MDDVGSGGCLFEKFFFFSSKKVQYQDSPVCELHLCFLNSFKVFFTTFCLFIFIFYQQKYHSQADSCLDSLDVCNSP